MPATKLSISPPSSETRHSPSGLNVIEKNRDDEAMEVSDSDGTPHKRRREPKAVFVYLGDLAPGAQLTFRTLDFLLRQLTSSHQDDYAFYDPGDLEKSQRPAKLSSNKFAKTRNVLVWVCLRHQ